MTGVTIRLVLAAVLAFAGVAAVINVTPGLDTMLVLRTSIAGGRAAGLVSGLGINTGCLAWGVAAAAGVTELLTASHAAYETVRIAGAVYLSWLGCCALPTEASTLPRAPEIAAKLAERLEAVRENDPLFGGASETADPGILLTPPAGKRARVSVISMIGLPEVQRPGFVNQLQMALFSWIKKHPAGDRPLGGLLVMDEAQTLAPAMGTTASTQSTLKLASQARKYGLGLLFATQSPHGLHNQIPGNATTQFFGLMSSSTQIETVRSLARVKGGDVPDIGRLSAGEFYLGPEGRGLQKIRTPMCLSYHPPSPLTEEEVIARARRPSVRVNDP